MVRQLFFLFLFLMGATLFSGCQRSEDDRPTIGYVTNGIASFWVIADRGARDAAGDHNAQVEVRMPPSGVSDQKRMVQDLIATGVDGIAISPIDPDNQGDLLDEIAQHAILITQDSDAPESKRLCYVGMDNYVAGRMCGKLVKDAIPEGGSVVIFIGRLAQENGRLRRQGVIDELLDRTEDPTRYDSPAVGELKGAKYTVLDTRVDDFDFPKAKAQAQEIITRFPDVDCMVGLFAYNPPLILEAVREARKLNQIKIVGFDEDEATLEGITGGGIFGTIVQNPYRYGYESVRILAGLARDDKSVLPENAFLNIEARRITEENVDEFWAELKQLTSEEPAKTDSSDK